MLFFLNSILIILCIAVGMTQGWSTQVSAILIFSLIVYVPLRFYRVVYKGSADYQSRLSTRFRKLIGRGTESASNMLVNEKGRAYFVDQMQARDDQRQQAIKEKDLPFADVGVTTGKLFQRKSFLSPSEPGLPFRINLASLSVHTIITGLTGSGKTSSLLRPIIGSIVAADKDPDQNMRFGLWIADRKISLQKDVSQVFRDFYTEEESPFYLINPDDPDCYFNPLAYLTLTQSADLISDIAVEASDDWKGHAYQLILSTLHCLKALRVPITLFNLDRACCDKQFFEKNYQEKLLGLLNSGDLDLIQRKFIKHRVVSFAEYPEKMAGSIIGIVSMAFSNILTDPKIARMSNATKKAIMSKDGSTVIYGRSFDVSTCLRGNKAGMMIDKERYGNYASMFFNIAAKQILFNECKIRGEHPWFGDHDYSDPNAETPCIMIADEVQSGLLTKAKKDEDQEDADMASTGRGYGMWMIYATQTISGLYKAIGKEAALQLLGNMRNKFFFTTDDALTAEYIEHEFGMTTRLVADGRASYADTNTAIDNMINSPEEAFRQRHGETRFLEGHSYYDQVDMVADLAYDDFQDRLMFHKHRKTMRNVTVDKENIAEHQFDHSLYGELDINFGKERYRVSDEPLIRRSEIQNLLPRKFMCLASVQRAGVQRMDVIQTTPVSNVVDYVNSMEGVK